MGLGGSFPARPRLANGASESDWENMMPETDDSMIEAMMKEMMREDVVKVMDDVLPPRLRRVLEYRFGFTDGRQRTLEEIGREFGVTRQRILQLQNEAIALLKASGKLPLIEDLEKR